VKFENESTLYLGTSRGTILKAKIWKSYYFGTTFQWLVTHSVK
jgi:hypothetical protein